jgi:hypothetical protein
MRILDRLPVDGEHYRLEIHGESLKIRPFQIIVQISASDALTWNAGAARIPTLLDTGLNHNFSIQEIRLKRWAGIHPLALPAMGVMRESDRTSSLRFANVWIHRNQPGKRDLRAGDPFLLALDEGIAIYPNDGSNYPRLPLLGLRAIIKNNLRLVIDGKRKFVSLNSPIW